MQQPMQNPKDISDPTAALDMALELMSKAFKLNNTTPTNNNQRSSSNPCYSQIAHSGMNIDQDRHMLMVDDNVGNQFSQNAVHNVGLLVGQNVVQNQGTQNVGNQNGLSVISGIANQNGNGNVVAARAEGNGNGINGNQIRCYNCQGMDHYASNCTVKPRKLDAAYLQKQMQLAQKEEAGIQLTQEEFDFMADAGAYEEIERVNANCTLKDNLQQASTSGTQTDKAPVYDSNGSAEVHHSENCYDNDIFNMFTQEEQYTELLEPIPEPHQVQAQGFGIGIERLLQSNWSVKILYKLHDTIYENAKLRAQLFDKVSEQKDSNKGTSMNTQFSKQPILGKPPSSSKPKLYSVTPFPKSMVIPKVGKSNALSKPVT
ncbi:gag-pol polyprotein [Tanacetum coccineum]